MIRSIVVFGLSFAIALGPCFVRRVSPEPASLDATPFFFALSVADVEASAAWYQSVFGFTPVRATDLAERGIKIRLLGREDGFLELTQSAAAHDLGNLEPAIEKRYLLRGVFKIGFVVERLDDAIERLEALDVPLRGRVITESDGSMRSLQVEDPDGNVVQIFERLEDGGPTSAETKP